MMPYMVSYMRQHSEGEAGRDLTYADFIVVQSAWGITQVRKCEKILDVSLSFVFSAGHSPAGCRGPGRCHRGVQVSSQRKMENSNDYDVIKATSEFVH